MKTKIVHDFEFLLFEGFSNIVLSCAMEPLRDAKLRADRRRANWVVSSLDGAKVRSSSGLQIIPDKVFNPNKPAKRLFLVAGYGVREIVNRQLKDALRTAARLSQAMIALDSASWLMADAGLLDGYAATIHWQELDAFAEAFPNVDVLTSGFVKSGHFYTCGGASSVLDLMFDILSDLFGPATAFEVSNMFIYSRSNASVRANDIPNLVEQGSKTLLAALDLISDSIETPLTTASIADQVGVSPRTLNRVFIKELQTTPGKFATLFRLKQAKYLAQSTELPLENIALRSGFGSAPSLCRAYKDAFGQTLRQRQ
jgi:transcriptional regulator GlxA family with amidase domain